MARYLTDLADTLHDAGLPVIEVPGWQSRGHGPMYGVRGGTAHHTAGPAWGDFPSLSVVRDGRPGLPGPLSQLGLGRNGTWYVVAAGLCYHAGRSDDWRWTNPYALGVEAEATGTDPWPSRQYRSYVAGCAALSARYDITWRGHKETAVPSGRKVDPNFSMDRFRRDIERAARVKTSGIYVEDTMTPEQWAALSADLNKIKTALEGAALDVEKTKSGVGRQEIRTEQIAQAVNAPDVDAAELAAHLAVLLGDDVREAVAKAVVDDDTTPDQAEAIAAAVVDHLTARLEA